MFEKILPLLTTAANSNNLLFVPSVIVTIHLAEGSVAVLTISITVSTPVLIGTTIGVVLFWLDDAVGEPTGVANRNIVL